MGGFQGGMIAGAVVVLVLGAVFSLRAPLSGKPEVASTAPEAAPVEQDEKQLDVADVGADADLVELPPQAPSTADQQIDTVAGLVDTETVPSDRPSIGSASEELAEPDVEQDSPVKVESVAPIAPPTPSPAPISPQEDTPPTIEEAPVVPEAPETVEIAVVEPEAEPEPESESEAEVTQVPADAPDAEVKVQDDPVATEGEETQDKDDLPRIAALPQIGGEQSSAGATIGRRVVPLTERDDAEQADDSTAAPVVPGKPIQAFAAEFQNTEEKPLMSIILIDYEGAFGAEALQDFPYPLSFAVSPTDPEAAEKMARYRAAGFEVLAMADLPKAASAQDAEVSLSVWLDVLPETVGILEGIDTGVQGNRKLADQVAAIAGGTGRGLVTQDNGLNTVQKLAARRGIPASVIFRDFDGAEQSPQTIRRFLDQAAFRAGQEGSVVMLGRLRPETISALLLWGLEDRSDRVALAPISAVLMSGLQ
ncbi:MAG: divergent polysaccharide deacetylase family protein [Ruegeria sp.]